MGKPLVLVPAPPWVLSSFAHVCQILLPLVPWNTLSPLYLVYVNHSIELPFRLTLVMSRCYLHAKMPETALGEVSSDGKKNDSVRSHVTCKFTGLRRYMGRCREKDGEQWAERKQIGVRKVRRPQQAPGTSHQEREEPKQSHTGKHQEGLKRYNKMHSCKPDLQECEYPNSSSSSK